MVCQFSSHDFSYWTKLQKSDRAQYDAEKSRIAEAVVTTLEARFGGIRSYLEMIDVSTPASVIEFTNNWQGSFEGWLITPESGAGPLKNTLPGLRNFYMAGHWVEPGGGVPTAMLSGRRLASRICREDGKSFTTESLARSGSPEI